MPMVLFGKCDGCGICVETCEQGAITLHMEKAHVDTELCISCGECVKACPTGALMGKKKKQEA